MKGSNTPEKEKFTVLNPEGIKQEIKLYAINPRLKTLSGKKVNIINLHGGNEVVLESIASELRKAVPDCNVVYYRTDGGQGGSPLTDEDWEKMQACDAAIIGHNY